MFGSGKEKLLLSQLIDKIKIRWKWYKKINLNVAKGYDKNFS